MAIKATIEDTKHTVTKVQATDSSGNSVIIQLEEEGTIPTPTATKDITGNGIFDVLEFATVNVNVPSSSGSGGSGEDIGGISNYISYEATISAGTSGVVGGGAHDDYFLNPTGVIPKFIRISSSQGEETEGVFNAVFDTVSRVAAYRGKNISTGAITLGASYITDARPNALSKWYITEDYFYPGRNTPNMSVVRDVPYTIEMWY